MLISVIPWTSLNTTESPAANDTGAAVAFSEFESVPIVTIVEFPLVMPEMASVLLEPSCRSTTVYDEPTSTDTRTKRPASAQAINGMFNFLQSVLISLVSEAEAFTRTTT